MLPSMKVGMLPPMRPLTSTTRAPSGDNLSSVCEQPVVMPRARKRAGRHVEDVVDLIGREVDGKKSAGSPKRRFEGEFPADGQMADDPVADDALHGNEVRNVRIDLPGGPGNELFDDEGRLTDSVVGVRHNGVATRAALAARYVNELADPRSGLTTTGNVASETIRSMPVRSGARREHPPRRHRHSTLSQRGPLLRPCRSSVRPPPADRSPETAPEPAARRSSSARQ